MSQRTEQVHPHAAVDAVGPASDATMLPLFNFRPRAGPAKLTPVPIFSHVRHHPPDFSRHFPTASQRYCQAATTTTTQTILPTQPSNRDKCARRASLDARPHGARQTPPNSSPKRGPVENATGPGSRFSRNCLLTAGLALERDYQLSSGATTWTIGKR